MRTSPAAATGFAPLRTTVTGKVATPGRDRRLLGDLGHLAGARLSLEPAATTCAVCPTAISLTSASLTEPVTSKTPGVMITMACVAVPLAGRSAAGAAGRDLLTVGDVDLFDECRRVGALSVAAATAACALVTLT